MADTARKAFIATLVAVAVVVGAVALWQIRILVGLLFLGFVIAAAMRPGIDRLAERRVPRSAGVAIHFLALFAFVGLVLWLAVPRALDQIEQAIGGPLPTSEAELERATRQTEGIRHELLQAVQRRLERLPSGEALLDPALEVTVTAFEVVVGLFFMLAAAAYWIFERDRAVRVVLPLVPARNRQTVRDTWDLVDAKLGAFVRGQFVLVLFVAGVLSLAFWLIGLKFWLLIAVFAGVVEIVPVIGPLAAGAVAVGVGLTQSWRVAAAAGIAVAAVRLFEDYLVLPRVLGHATGLSPLIVLFSVTATGLLLGGFYVLLAVPLAAVLATVVDVAVRDKDPAEEDVPAVLFPAKDVER